MQFLIMFTVLLLTELSAITKKEIFNTLALPVNTLALPVNTLALPVNHLPFI